MFPSPDLGKGSMSPFSTGKGSACFPVQTWEKVLCVPKTNTGKRFYRLSSPMLRKGSWFPKPVQGYVL